MVRLALATAASLALAACYNPRYPSEAPGHDREAPAPVTSSSGTPVLSSPAATAGTLRPGYGVVESITLLPTGSAAAGGTVVSARGYEVRVRMDDGTVQYALMTDPPTFRVGDRVEVTSSALIRR